MIKFEIIEQLAKEGMKSDNSETFSFISRLIHKDKITNYFYDGNLTNLIMQYSDYPYDFLIKKLAIYSRYGNKRFNVFKNIKQTVEKPLEK